MIKKIRRRLKKVTKSDILRLMKKAVMATGKALIYTFYAVAIMNVILNMVFITCLTILEWMGKVVIMPDYLRIDGYFTAVIMLAAVVIMHHRRKAEEEEAEMIRQSEERQKRAIEEAKINNQNWKTWFRIQMMKNINYFRVNNQLTVSEERKFRRIVDYTIRELDKEAKENGKGTEAEMPEKQ